MLLVFTVTSVFGEEGLAVKVGLSSDSHRIVPPKSILTSIFVISNSGIEEDSYDLEPEVPADWQVISSLEPLILSPGATKTVPLTVSIPSSALADYTYELSLSAISQKDRQIKDKATVTVGILPHARVKVIGPAEKARAMAGQSLSYNFTVMNLGNGKDRFEITAASAHGEKIDLSTKIIELGVGEKTEIKATIHIPLDVSEGTSHVLTLKATSVLLEKGVSDKVMVYTSLLARKRPKEEGIYKTIPSDMVFHLSGLGTGRDLGPQAEFYTSGELDDNHWLNFSYQGPYFKDRENYKGLSEERISFEYGSEDWDIGLGDTTVSLSDLTASSLSEQGVRLRVRKDPLSFKFFDMEKKNISFKETLLGARIASKIGKGAELGLNFFQSEEDKTDPGAARAPEKKEILSVSTQHILKDFVIHSEYASSRFDDTSGERQDSAWWIDGLLKKEKLHMYSEYIHAGSDFSGRRKDSDGYRVFFSYNLLKPLWVWIQRSDTTDNLNNDPNQTSDDKDSNEIGASLSAKGFPFLSLTYQLDKDKSEQQTLLSDSRKDTVLFRAQDSFGRYMLSFDYEWRKEEDDIKSIDTVNSDYTTRVYGRWNKFSGWLGYGYNIEDDRTQDTKTTFIRKEAGLNYQPLPKMYSSITFSQEETTGQNKNDMISLVTSYAPWEDTSISLEGEYRNDHAEFIKEWQFWLTFRKRFDMPVPVARARGRVDGYIFIDENNNGLADKGEQGVSKIILLLDDKKVLTNNKGRFRFPSVVPGRYELDADISSLPFGASPGVKLPYKLSVAKGKSVNVNIPLVRVCRVSGTVFNDKNKNKKMDWGEKGLALVRVVLVKEAEIYKDTFSDADGKYGFSGILPGKYNVGIDKKWLPKRYKLTTPGGYQLDLAPQQEVKGLDFGAFEKEKKIIKTYTAPKVEKVEPVYVEKEPEEEKEYPKPFRFFIFVFLMVVFTLILVWFARRFR